MPGRSFADFDEFGEAIAGWDMHWRQLEPGRADAELIQVTHGSALLTHVRLGRRVFQSGGTPQGVRTFGIMRAGGDPIVAMGREMNDASILPFPDDYEAFSGAGFEAHTVAIAEESLLLAAETTELQEPLARALRQDTAVAASGRALRALRSHLDGLVFGPRSATLPATYEDEMSQELAVLLVRALSSVEGDGERGAGQQPPNREQIARRARRFMQEREDDPPTIAEVSRRLGVSRRTLEYAFQEQVGVAPKQYLQALRLQGVRRALTHAAPATRVSDVAARFGFWHLGQLAADYRRWFGERPSQTLARSLASNR